MFWLRIVVALACCVAVGRCVWTAAAGNGAASGVRTKPITAGGLVFHAPPGADRGTWSPMESGGLIELCSLAPLRGQPDNCVRRDPALSSLADRTFRVLVHDRKGVRWYRIGERPIDALAPGHLALIPTDIAASYNFEDPEWYAIERIRAFIGSRKITTTAVHWPLVSCEARGSDTLCVMGFRIGSAFVETMWWTNRQPDQAEIWRVGSGIDSRLRGFLVAEAR